MKKFWKYILLSVCMLSVFTGCGQKKEQDGTVTAEDLYE